MTSLDGNLRTAILHDPSLRIDCPDIDAAHCSIPVWLIMRVVDQGREDTIKKLIFFLKEGDVAGTLSEISAAIDELTYLDHSGNARAQYAGEIAELLEDYL